MRPIRIGKYQPAIKTEYVKVQLEPFGHEVTLIHQTEQYCGHRWLAFGKRSDWHQDNSVAFDELMRKISFKYKEKDYVQHSNF